MRPSLPPGTFAFLAVSWATGFKAGSAAFTFLLADRAIGVVLHSGPRHPQPPPPEAPVQMHPRLVASGSVRSTQHALPLLSRRQSSPIRATASNSSETPPVQKARHVQMR